MLMPIDPLVKYGRGFSSTRARVLTAARAARPGRAAVKTVALDDENCRPFFINEAIIISIQNQDSICVNRGLYIIRKIIGFSSELVVSVFRDPIILY